MHGEYSFVQANRRLFPAYWRHGAGKLTKSCELYRNLRHALSFATHDVKGIASMEFCLRIDHLVTRFFVLEYAPYI